MASPISLVDPPPTSPAPPLTELSQALGQASHDARALRILAKTIYRELRQGGLLEEDVMTLAGELLSLVACEVKDRRRVTDPLPGPRDRA